MTPTSYPSCDEGGRVEPYRFQSARELFECARGASRDAESARRQLQAMEQRTLSIGGGGFEPRVRSTTDPDKMSRRVGMLLDMESRLRERQADAYALLDLASRVLYGDDSTAGLWALVGWRADAIYHHYIDDLKWAVVASMLGYSETHVRQQVQVAFDICDGWGVDNIIAGMGAAQE